MKVILIRIVIERKKYIALKGEMGRFF